MTAVVCTFEKSYEWVLWNQSLVTSENMHPWEAPVLVWLPPTCQSLGIQWQMTDYRLTKKCKRPLQGMQILVPCMFQSKKKKDTHFHCLMDLSQMPQSPKMSKLSQNKVEHKRFFFAEQNFKKCFWMPVWNVEFYTSIKNKHSANTSYFSFVVFACKNIR